MKRASRWERFRYWFDNRMSKGTGSMIRMLALVTLVFVFLLALVVTLLGVGSESGFGFALWDSFASTVNAWVLYSGDGSAAYIVLMAVAAVVGLFVTSLLVGIISTGIEERVGQLRRGMSRILETDHTVILGFNSGAYELIRELCLAGAGRKNCIVVAGSEDKEVMEEHIRDNVDIPARTRIICRNIDVCDPAALRCCAIPQSRSVIVNQPADSLAIRCILAVSALLRDFPDSPVRVVCPIYDKNAAVPARVAGEGRADVLHMGDVVARIIAHTCTEAGISSVFTDLFNFAGSEFYFKEFPALCGKTFSDAVMSLDGATPFGIEKGGFTMLNPKPGTRIEKGGRLLILAENADSCSLLPEPISIPNTGSIRKLGDQGAERILVLGCNRTLPTIVRELQSESCAVTVAGWHEEDRCVMDETPHVSFSDADVLDDDSLEKLASQSDHIVLLSDYDKNADDADHETLMLLLRLRDIKERLELCCNITTEMQLESNKALAMRDSLSDFIVASDLSALMVAQVSQTPELVSVFGELLSNEGNELYLVPASLFFEPNSTATNARLRAAALERGALYIGYKRSEGSDGAGIYINPPLRDTVSLSASDSVIVLCAQEGIFGKS